MITVKHIEFAFDPDAPVTKGDLVDILNLVDDPSDIDHIEITDGMQTKVINTLQPPGTPLPLVPPGATTAIVGVPITFGQPANRVVMK